MPATSGFPPLLGRRPRVLILGSLPSQKSIQSGQYYGNSQNVFWKIMGDLFGAGPDIAYPERTATLVSRHIAVWDVLASSERPGSMDSAIVRDTAVANDFSGFLGRQPDITLICFNGQTAAKLFRKMVPLKTQNDSAGVDFVTMPSTSPAYAAMSYADKLESWSVIVAATITE